MSNIAFREYLGAFCLKIFIWKLAFTDGMILSVVVFLNRAKVFIVRVH